MDDDDADYMQGSEDEVSFILLNEYLPIFS